MMTRAWPLVGAVASIQLAGIVAFAAPALAVEPDSVRREPSGDLNRLFMGPGEASGTWLIPGERGNLALGGFVKVVTSIDDHNERRDPLNNPELLSAGDEEGRFQVNPTLTRLFLDGRGPIKDGSVRGYTEFDLANEPGFRVRHAYVTLYHRNAAYTAGQTWSTFVDTDAFPGEASLPNTSGISTSRRGVLRTAGRISEVATLSGSIEDPSSSDIALSGGARRIHDMPDFHGELMIRKEGTGHLSFAAVMRALEVAGPTIVDGSVLAAGLHASGALTVNGRNRLTAGLVVGDGLGDYVVGLDATSAGYVDGNGNLQSRGTVGGYGSFRWFWSETARSNVFGGFAEADTDPGQPGGTFHDTRYLGGNVVWRVVPGVNLAVEYVYGRRENDNGASFENNRFAFVMQLL